MPWFEVNNCTLCNRDGNLDNASEVISEEVPRTHMNMAKSILILMEEGRKRRNEAEENQEGTEREKEETPQEAETQGEEEEEEETKEKEQDSEGRARGETQGKGGSLISGTHDEIAESMMSTHDASRIYPL